MSASPSAAGKARPPKSWSPNVTNTAVAVLVVPLSLLVGRWVGSLPANTVLAAVSALLIFLVLPPVAVAGVERARLLRQGVGSPRTGAAVGAALGVQVLVLAGATWMGASARRLGDAALVTLVEALVLPAVVAWVMRRSSPATSSSAVGGQA
jgi:hypothetical protein